MWHYPLLQTFFIGLSNAATQASGSLGFVFNSLAEEGVNIVESFLVLAGLSLLSGLVFLLSCPTKLQTLTQAGRVLNTHPSSLDVYSIVGWKAIKHSVKEACGVYNLYPRQNTCMLLYIGFFMAGELTCISGLEARYRALFQPAEADSLLAAYATLMAVLGIVVNPAAGLLFDYFGFLNVFAFSSFLAFLVPFTLMVPIVWVQLLSLFLLVTWFSLFLNVVSRYSVTFAPPDFFGTFTGFLTSLAGIIAYFVDAVLQLPSLVDLSFNSESPSTPAVKPVPMLRRLRPVQWAACHRLRGSRCCAQGGHGKRTQPGLAAAWATCSREERRQLAVLSASGAVLNLGFGVVIPALPALSQELGFGALGVGLLLGVPGLARVLVNLPAGVLVDRLGRVPAMVAGELVAALGCLGTALGTSIGTMLPLRFLGGSGASLAAAGSAAYVADMTEKSHLKPFRGAIVGAQGGLISAAYVVGPVIGGLLTQRYGAPMAYATVAGLIAVCGAAYATLPEPRQRTSGVEMRLGILLRDAANDWRSLLQDPRQQALFGCNLALSLNYAALVTIMPLQAFHTFGTTAAEIGGLFSIGSATGIFLAPVAGALSDRWGRAPLLAPSLAVCAAGCFGVAFSQQWELFVLSNLLWSVGEAVLGPVLSAYAADIAPKEKVGSALSLGRQAGDLVFFLAPPVLGFIYDKWPDQGAMMLPAVLTLVCAAAVRHRLK
ncbi:norA [Symbiodinium microadriaticum]|nr:norA [Symbiodinium microadriaticum]